MTDIDEAIRENAHAAGYEAAEEDLIEWISDTFNEWRQLKIYTHEELFAMHELVAELRIRQARRGN